MVHRVASSTLDPIIYLPLVLHLSQAAKLFSNHNKQSCHADNIAKFLARKTVAVRTETTEPQVWQRRGKH